MNSFDAIFFDFDGLIVDTESVCFQAWAEFYAEEGHELSHSTYAACIGTAGAKALIDEIEARTGKTLSTDTIDRIDRRQDELALELPALPGIESLIDETDSSEIPRAVVSSGPRSWVTGLLASVGLAGGWSSIICADGDHARAKPNPHLYLEAIEATGVSAGRALALEDSPNGVKAAKSAGLLCIAVPCPMTAALDLSGADLILPTLEGVRMADLERLLGS